MNRRQFITLFSFSALYGLMPFQKSKEELVVIDVARQEINIYNRYKTVIKVSPHSLPLA